MIRTLSTIALMLFALASVLGQESGVPQTTNRVRPCAVPPVKGRMCLSEEQLRRMLLRLVRPKLPEGANENGEVVLHVIVPRKGGRPAKISVVSGDPVLTRSAVRAVRDWVFIAYTYEGKLVEVEGDLHIGFEATR